MYRIGDACLVGVICLVGDARLMGAISLIGDACLIDMYV